MPPLIFIKPKGMTSHIVYVFFWRIGACYFQARQHQLFFLLFANLCWVNVRLEARCVAALLTIFDQLWFHCWTAVILILPVSRSWRLLFHRRLGYRACVVGTCQPSGHRLGYHRSIERVQFSWHQGWFRRFQIRLTIVMNLLYRFVMSFLQTTPCFLLRQRRRGPAVLRIQIRRLLISDGFA